MNVLDLFSGIGAFSLAAESIGANIVAHSEIDKNRQKLLARHFPGVRQLGDIEKVNPNDISETIDLIAGGSPCQNLSVAGSGEGLAGAESRLWFEYFRLAKALKPRWLVWENVPNALSTNGGADFLTILRGLDECGYHVAWRILDAQHFGVPQRRRRIFLVGHLGDGRAAKVLFERESLPGTLKTRPGTWLPSPTAGTLTASASGTARTSGMKNQVDLLVWQKLRSDKWQEDAQVASSLLSRDSKDGGDLLSVSPMVTHRMNSLTGKLETINLIEDSAGGKPKPQSDLLSFNPSRYLRGFGSELHETEIANTLQANNGRGHAATDEHIILGFSPATYKRDFDNKPFKEIDVASTLMAPRKGWNDTTECITVNGLIRRFTPLECERLQGYPDGWTEGFSDTVRYSALGDSIATVVALWVFGRIKAVDCELANG